MISAELLRRIRNDLPMAAAIAALGRDGPPSKLRDGRFVFLCPRCGELLAAVNPRNNLAHCFACHRNLNNIDLLRALGHDFLSAVALLERWLNQYQLNDRSDRRLCRRRQSLADTFSKIHRNLANRSRWQPNPCARNSATNARSGLVQ